MQNRVRLLQGATALLYFGPLLAGLGGFGWAVVPVFAGIFLFWLVIIRPQEFPRSLADWARPDALIALAARGATQLLLVLVCFGIGRGIGGVLGSLPTIPPMLPVGISFLAIPLARLLYDPWQAKPMDKLLEDALAKIESGGAAQSGDRAYAEAVTAPLNGLPDDAGESELESHLSALRTLTDEGVTFEVLLSRVQNGEASMAGKRALMIMASDGALLARADRPDMPADMPMQAMNALGADAALVARMAERLLTALRQDPKIWVRCPNLGFLEGLRAKLPAASAAISALEAEISAQAAQG